MPTQFLDLANRLLRRVNEVEIDQADFASVRGVQAFAKDAVNAAIEEINQQDFEWPFNAASGSQLLTIYIGTYAFPATYKVAEWESFYINNDSTLGTNASRLQPISKEQWYMYLRDRDVDHFTNSTGEKPRYVYPESNGNFGIAPVPDQAYTVKYEYYLNPVRLSLYSDVSTIPSVYDEVIMEGALYHFYTFRDNTTQANITQKKFMNKLGSMRTQLVNKYDHMDSHMVSTTSPVGRPSESII